jgi:hypothetical protein
MGLYDDKPCPCGSGQSRSPNWDARGIFLTFTCVVCHDGKMKRYRPEVLTNSNYEADEPIEPEEY